MEEQINWNVIAKAEDVEIRSEVKRLGPAKLKFESEPHLACCLLVDTSGSMKGRRIQQLNDALARFKKQVCQDEQSAMRVDVCLIEFNSDVRVVVPFCPITEFNPPQLEASGCTSIGEGIRYALEAVHEQVHAYHDKGIECYKPFVLMITDGQPTDDVGGVSELIRAREGEGRYGHLRFHAFGVEGADMDLLTTFTNRVLAVDKYDFSQIFCWLSESMKIISHSETTDNVLGADIGSNMYPVVKGKPLPWEN